MYNLGDMIEGNLTKSTDNSRLGGDVNMLQEEPLNREILNR